MEPENPQAYLGKLLAELRCHTLEALSSCSRSFEDSPNYKKLIRFGDPELAEAVNAHLTAVKQRPRQEGRSRRKWVVAALCGLCVLLAAAMLFVQFSRKPTWEQLIRYRANMTLEESLSFAKKCGFEKASIIQDENYVLITYGDWYGGLHSDSLSLFLHDSAENYRTEVRSARKEIEALCGDPVREDTSEFQLAGDFVHKWYEYPGGYIEFVTHKDEDSSDIMIFLYPGQEIP